MTTNGDNTEASQANGNGTNGAAHSGVNEDLEHRDETNVETQQRKKPRPRRERPAAPPPIDAAVSSTPEKVVLAGVTTEAPKVPEVPEAPEVPKMTPPPVEAPSGNLRLRMKIWTDLKTGKQYLMPAAFMRDVVKGRPVSDVMHAYAMRDDETKLVTLTASEWNSLPFYYFRQDGPAPRATARPVDVIR